MLTSQANLWRMTEQPLKVLNPDAAMKLDLDIVNWAQDVQYSVCWVVQERGRWADISKQQPSVRYTLILIKHECVGTACLHNGTPHCLFNPFGAKNYVFFAQKEPCG